jgi:hypothetical protein
MDSLGSLGNNSYELGSQWKYSCGNLISDSYSQWFLGEPFSFHVSPLWALSFPQIILKCMVPLNSLEKILRNKVSSENIHAKHYF